MKIKWGDAGVGHECGVGCSNHKWMSNYKGILVSKETVTKKDSTETVCYIEDVNGEYQSEDRLKKAIDILIKQLELNPV